MQEKPLVSVLCLAYNHEKYIRQCLDSIVTQETGFSFEVLVNDDASTDSTANIIKEYESKYPFVKGIYHSENQGHNSNIMIPDLIDVAEGEYIAFCECDDYFLDKKKLKIQIEKLQSRPEAVACIHSAYRVNEMGKIVGRRSPFVEKEVLQLKDIISCIGRNYALNSLFCRKDVVKDLRNDPLFWACTVGDIPISLHIAQKGNFIYLNDNLSAYRVNSVGSWTQRMRHNIEAKKRYTDSVINILAMLDSETTGIYHKEIAERIKAFEFQMIQSSYDLKSALSKKYWNQYSSLSIKQKCTFFVGYIANWKKGNGLQRKSHK